MRYDLLILGRGIAGAVLAESARQRGLSVHLFDRKQPGSATLAAGGAVNPVVLRRGSLCWGAEFLMPSARSFFTAWDRRTGLSCWHDDVLVQLFADAKQADQWKQAMARPGMAAFLARRPEPEIDHGPFRAPYGHGTVTDAGWLDLPRLLDAQREELLREEAITECVVAEDEVQAGLHGASVAGIQGRWLVRCTGPFSDHPGLVPVKGESLTVRIPGLKLSRIVHGGTGLLAVGNDLFRVGSTFKWTDVWEGPTAQARDWMLDRLSEMLDAPVEVVEHHAGVRPAARDRKPILGKTGPSTAVMNGLGARGVMQAPWCAKHLLDHLLDGKPLDPAVDAARYA
ncbi:MAG: FAD-binding oxidoreductase [Flavobacteriales bacterium]|nr:FAD-binding oxidoreductase [Flavobacteriales bacterium]